MGALTSWDDKECIFWLLQRAHELFATLSDASVEADVGAGQIFEAVKVLVCILEPSEIEDKGGGGATCTFTAGQ